MHELVEEREAAEDLEGGDGAAQRLEAEHLGETGEARYDAQAVKVKGSSHRSVLRTWRRRRQRGMSCHLSQSDKFFPEVLGFNKLKHSGRRSN